MQIAYWCLNCDLNTSMNIDDGITLKELPTWIVRDHNEKAGEDGCQDPDISLKLDD